MSIIKDEKESEQFLDKQIEKKPTEVKVYKRRWLVMLIFVYYACINTTQILQYCSITPTVVKYYNVSTTAVEWTSIISMALYPILIFPVSMIINKKGLRMAAFIGCFGTLIGTVIKVFAVRSDLFWILFTGQTILAVALLAIWSLPAKIASTWFSQEQISTASSLGMFGVQFGIAVGFVLPPIIVKHSEDLEAMGQGFNLLHWILAGMIIPGTIAVLVYFPNNPPLPPTETQAELRESRANFSNKEFYSSIKKVLLSKAFLIHLTAFSLSISAYSALSTLLTQYILEFFEGAYEHAGRMGFLMVVCGMVGSITFGIILDKSRKYKELAVIIYIGAMLCTIALLYSLQQRNMLWTYIICGFAGLCSSGYVLVGFELTIELTFPTEETTTTGILLGISQLIATFFTIFDGYLNLWLGCYWSMFSQITLLAIGAVIQFFVPNELMRQEAFKRIENAKKDVIL